MTDTEEIVFGALRTETLIALAIEKDLDSDGIEPHFRMWMANWFLGVDRTPGAAAWAWQHSARTKAHKRLVHATITNAKAEAATIREKPVWYGRG